MGDAAGGDGQFGGWAQMPQLALVVRAGMHLTTTTRALGRWRRRTVPSDGRGGSGARLALLGAATATLAIDVAHARRVATPFAHRLRWYGLDALVAALWGLVAP